MASNCSVVTPSVVLLAVALATNVAQSVLNRVSARSSVMYAISQIVGTQTVDHEGKERKSLNKSTAFWRKESVSLRQDAVFFRQNAISFRQDAASLRRDAVPFRQDAVFFRQNAASLHRSAEVHTAYIGPFFDVSDVPRHLAFRDAEKVGLRNVSDRSLVLGLGVRP